MCMLAKVTHLNIFRFKFFGLTWSISFLANSRLCWTSLLSSRLQEWKLISTPYTRIKYFKETEKHEKKTTHSSRKRFLPTKHACCGPSNKSCIRSLQNYAITCYLICSWTHKNNSFIYISYLKSKSKQGLLINDKINTPRQMIQFHQMMGQLQREKKGKTHKYTRDESLNKEKIVSILKPDPATVDAPPPETPIISDSFFRLTSSSFSSDFSKGLMPTD